MKNHFTFKLFTLLFSLAVIAYSLVSIYRIISTLAPDFSVYFQSTKLMLSGQNPYLNRNLFTGLGYPLATLVVFIPFAFLPFNISQALFLLISYGSVFTIVSLVLKILKKKIKIHQYLLLCSLVLFSFPVKFTLGMGQSNLIAYLLLLISFYNFKRSKDFTSGVFLGLTILLKPVLGFIGLYYLLYGKHRILWASAIVLVGGIVISLMFAGIAPYIFYFTSVVPDLLKPIGREIYYNQGIAGFVFRLTSGTFLRTVVSLLLSFGFIVFTFLKTKAIKNQKVVVFSLFLITLTLVDSLSWQHHFVFLIFPFVFLVFQHKKRLALVFAYLLVAGNIGNPEIFTAFPLNLLLSHVFYGTLIVYLLLLKSIKKEI